MTDISLALGSGGVRGGAHVGVMRALERAGFRIRAIAGTSAGGMIGSLYAAGFTPDEIEQQFAALDRSKLYARQPGDGPSAVGLAGVNGLFATALGERTFSDLDIPFAVTAADLNTARLVALRRGRVCDAVMATIAIPGLFPPRPWDDMLLVDGAVYDPVPVALARTLAPGLPVVAVALPPPLDDWGGVEAFRLLDEWPKLSRFIARLRVTQAINVTWRGLDMFMNRLSDLSLQIQRPEVVVKPCTPFVNLWGKTDNGELVRVGEEAMDCALPELRRLFTWRSRLARAFRQRSLPRFEGTIYDA